MCYSHIGVCIFDTLPLSSLSSLRCLVFKVQFWILIYSFFDFSDFLPNPIRICQGLSATAEMLIAFVCCSCFLKHCFIANTISHCRNWLLLRSESCCGGDEENRTPDPLLARQVLSQLSYTPKFLLILCQFHLDILMYCLRLTSSSELELLLFQFVNAFLQKTFLVGLSGLEPPTSRLSGVRSNRLSYRPAGFLNGFLSFSFPLLSIFFCKCSIISDCTFKNK